LVVTRGAAKFVFFDDDDPAEMNESVVVGSGDCPVRIAVPPGVWHGWKALVDRTTVVVVSSVLRGGEEKKGKLDEERVRWDAYGSEIWETESW
jgi:dTDP-4-dehydrorhamnose 3,5-epimerase-like enzyme